MDTLLEHICQELMGPPADQSGARGEAYWPCPRCGGSSFHTLPDHPKFKHRAKCYKCGFLGDAYDVMLAVDPVRWGNYGHRRAAIEMYEYEWTRAHDGAPDDAPVASLFRGGGPAEAGPTVSREAICEAVDALEDHMPWVDGPWLFIVLFESIAFYYRVPGDVLEEAFLEHMDWLRRGRKQDELREYILYEKLRHWKKKGRLDLVRRHKARAKAEDKRFRKQIGEERYQMLKRHRPMPTFSTLAELKEGAKNSRRLKMWKKRPKSWAHGRWVAMDYYTFPKE